MTPLLGKRLPTANTKGPKGPGKWVCMLGYVSTHTRDPQTPSPSPPFIIMHLPQNKELKKVLTWCNDHRGSFRPCV